MWWRIASGYLLWTLLVACGHFSPKATTTPLLVPKWSQVYDPPHQTGNLPIALNYPLIHEGVVFIGTGFQQMLALDLESGRKIWSTQEEGDFVAAPIYYEGQIVYGTTQGRLLARDAATGKKIYEVDLGASVEATPVVAHGRVIAHLRNHQLVVLDALTGKIFWSYRRSVPYLTTLQRASVPLVAGNQIFVGLADGHAICLQLEDGTLLWERKLTTATKFVDVDNGPILWGGQIVIGPAAGPTYFLDPSNGRILRVLEEILSRNLQIIDGKLLGMTVAGELLVFSNQGQVEQRVKISESAISSVVSWKKLWAISTVGGEIFLVSPHTYQVVERKFFGSSDSAVFGQLAVEGDALVVYTSRHRLHLF